ncbi:MAG TPA: ribonuclease HII [Ignavibacteria bacterium]|nr:ribonuclease HII [Ignavibacteria bacterium]HMR38998.1 ribonuclease HII [Ignavibacteria bacterium]
MLICGIDEAGRGPLAGPVVAAAVVFEDNFIMEGVKDSKVLTEFQRDEYFLKITEMCLDYKVIEISNVEIDEINILQATMKAMYLALKSLNVKPEKYLIDGNYFKLPGKYQTEINYETIVKGDSKVFAISAASVLAKVTRDRIMKENHLKFPGYEFGRHKGYATKLHDERIKQLGLCEIHRRSFCSKYLKESV